MRIIKKAIEIGNGAAVYIPKEYSGKEIVILLPDGIKEIKNEILQKLIPYMNNIVGVYLYGSYARDEQTLDSDTDVLVITKDKDDDIKKDLQDIDVRVISLENVKKSIKEYPLLIIPILKEAIVLLNPILLEELQTNKIDFRKLKWSFDDIKRIIKIIEEFIKIDENNIAPSHVYSLLMRIRGCYVMECLLKNKKYSNQGVKKRLEEYGLEGRLISTFFEIYRKIREEEQVKIKVNKEEITRLINILKQYSKKIEHETAKKTRKGN
ncbi:MAG: nucleotidyltransferase domain-containing protein [Nanoarchaeota archaeon]